ncbi:hypothetical protein ACSBR1_037434 [Camellia fascicularis]
MATPFHLPVIATQVLSLSLKRWIFGFQVGTYFVGQYYQVLQQQPDFVHQFYSEANTMLRIDGNSGDSHGNAGIVFLDFLCMFVSVCRSGIGNWKLILNSYRDIFEERTEVDLKDKWRNMIRMIGRIVLEGRDPKPFPPPMKLCKENGPRPWAKRKGNFNSFGSGYGTFCAASWKGIEVAVKKLGEEVTADEDKIGLSEMSLNCFRRYDIQM